MIPKYFIDRPIFAAVLSILLILGGSVSYLALPTTQYPDITPPTIEVSTIYPGANAELVRDTIASPIEQQVSGVENAMYMSSQCTNDGRYRLVVTFAPGTDLNMAQVLTQVRVSLALPILPDLVQRQGVAVLKKGAGAMMIINFTSKEDPSGKSLFSDTFLSNFATIQVRDELLRVDGVGDVGYIGQRDYSMRAWLNPERLAILGLTTDQVVTALTQQNYQVAAGNIGQQPAPAGQAFQITLSAQGRLISEAEFGNIIIRAVPGQDQNTDAVIIRLKDIARIELGSQQYDQICTLDGKPSVGLTIYQLPGSNAIKTAAAVRAKMAELFAGPSKGLDYNIVYDTTPFIEESKAEVLKTLRDAIILVALVVLAFLQNWRATLIPLIAVPVAIIGTFILMAALGFSLNNLSLFGLVLAIGIVVDDAIVVVENVERWMEMGLSPRDASVKAMEEVTGPVLGVALVLTAVFVPCAFISGIVGQFFRQFALTIAVSTLLSAMNSLTLSPALAALLLKPKHAKPDPLDLLLRWTLGWFFFLFNKGFDVINRIYGAIVGGALRVSLLVLIAYVGMLWLTAGMFQSAPTGFIPQQDKGYLIVNITLPDGASLERTSKIIKRMEETASSDPAVTHTVSIAGQSLVFGANSPNWGAMYVMLKGFSDRKGEEGTSDAVSRRLKETWEKLVPDARIEVFGAPPVDGLGTVGGFKLVVEDRGDYGGRALQDATDQLALDAGNDPQFRGIFTNYRADTPWIWLDIDRDKVVSLGVSIQDLFQTLQVNLGSYYVNQFNRFGRSWQVNIQADGKNRTEINEILNQLKVKNNNGDIIPLATLMRAQSSTGPSLVMRYNLYPAAAILGEPAPGVSSTTALNNLKAKFDKFQDSGDIPGLMSADWTEMAYMQIRSGNTAMLLFALGVVLVFLVLAALYESWALPFAVILVVPMCLLSAIFGLLQAGMDVNIFGQIGFVVLVGLACKNAILFVEFAKQLREEGKPLRQAALEACTLRLRPILMTSFAFILGVVPLVIAEGAGAEMRRTLGQTVFCGMLGVTGFGIFLTPVFFYSVLYFAKPPKRKTNDEIVPTESGKLNTPPSHHA
jgi:multidrug efflux pump